MRTAPGMAALLTTIVLATGARAGERDADSEAATARNQSTWPRPVFYFDEQRNRYARITAALQLWLRTTDLNPGSAVSGQPETDVTDVSIRRLRLGTWIAPLDRTMLRLNLGFNNFNRQTRGDVNLEVLDAYAEYRLSDRFHIGAGKSGWNGLSRYAAPNPMTALAYDLPMVAIPTINVTDNLLRTFGFFAKGQIGRLDYRVTAYEPDTVENSAIFDPDPEEDIAKFRDELSGNTTGYSAYLKWQFFEHEDNGSAFSPGTYLGEKKVMALGIGYEFDSNRTEHLQDGEPVLNDLKLMAVDFFMDLPLDPVKKNAVTVYVAFFDYDYGPNFVRNIGVNNIATAADPDQLSFNGPGNAYPVLGSGTSWYLQAGYLTRDLGIGPLQPYFSVQRSGFDRLADPMISWNAGVHWLINQHRSKLTLNVESRPLYFENDGNISVEDRKLMFVVQYQITM